MSKKAVVVALLAAAGLIAAVAIAGAWIIFGPNTQSYEGSRSVKIPPQTGFQAATDSLSSAGILASSRTFDWMGRATGWGGQIKAGHYRIDAGASNYDILSTLRRGLQSPIRVTIPPGTRPEIMAMLAGSVMHFDSAEMEAALSDPELAAELGTDTSTLFGYMLPESYDFYWLTSAPEVVRRIKQYFDQFYDRELAEYAQANDMDKEDVVTLASIIEWETHIEGERARVAGVYLNRLRIGMPLQADPTVQFAVMANEGQKRRLLYEDYRLEHAFNTYLFQGLPPGPITNPSPASLRAVANSEDHDYLYFVATGDGDHVFSESFQEHVRAANRYRETMRARRLEQESASP